MPAVTPVTVDTVVTGVVCVAPVRGMRSVGRGRALRHAVRAVRAAVSRVLVMCVPVSRWFGHNLLHPPKAI
ncbi:hypothetical protein GCM10010412_090990 [Nonomuraea recticatena]|uniref:Uncharacterized protein n=1 Tax=Nonomuraea recticatena TaxID=46178 RepID=A0ABP6FQT3_9ACTN